MSIPPRLVVKFDEAFGREAAEDLVTVFDGFRADVAEVRQQVVGLEQRMNDRFHGVDRGLQDLRVQMERQHAELLKWSFVFWVGAVAAIAALAGVLRA